MNPRQAVPEGRILEEIEHKQPATSIQTDNTTALGFVTKNNPESNKTNRHAILVAM